MRRLGAIIVVGVISLNLTGCERAPIQISETDIEVMDEKIGAGKAVEKGDYVTVNYDLRTREGETVLSQTNFSFTAGTGVVILGIDDAVIGMKAGGTRTVSIPPQRHWGRAGYGDKVPPNTTIVGTVTVKRVGRVPSGV
ncbi:MAG: FKBP-type peptidyl-prolyl cis-trans isomerase [Planctomycetota bacterium]